MAQHVVTEEYRDYSRRTFSNSLMIIGVFIFCIGGFIFTLIKGANTNPQPSFLAFGIITAIIGVLLFIWGIKRRL